MQNPINAAMPKISKNRLLGDFCSSLLFDNINSIILVLKQKILVRYIVHVPVDRFEYPASILVMP
jgi:hypothetical protein